MHNIKEALEKLKNMNVELQGDLKKLSSALEDLNLNLKRLSLEIQWAKEKSKS